MQVFQKERVGARRDRRGDRGAKLCAGRTRGRRAGWTAGTSSRCTRCTRATDRAVRDGDDDRGRLRAVRPPRDRLPRLARAPLAGHAQRAEVVEAASGKPILFFPARHDHWLVQTGDGWAAHVAGAIGVSTDAQASWWGGRGVGTVPHGLIAAFGGDTVDGGHGVRRPLLRRDERDRAGGLRQRLGAHGARGRRRARATSSGASGSTPRSGSWTARSGTRWAISSPPASTRARREGARRARRARATSDVKIVVSRRLQRGAHPASSRRPASRRLLRGGSSLLRGRTTSPPTWSALDGRPCAKVGAGTARTRASSGSRARSEVRGSEQRPRVRCRGVPRTRVAAFFLPHACSVRAGQQAATPSGSTSASRRLAPLRNFCRRRTRSSRSEADRDTPATRPSPSPAGPL